MKTIGTLLFTLLLSCLCAPRSGATVYHSNGSAANVQALHNAAQNGDTITLPTGTFTWTTSVSMTKAITLQGSGVGNTIVKDGRPSGAFLVWTLAANMPSRMTGIEFQDAGGTNQEYNGLIAIFGATTDGRTMRVDHCKFDHLNGVNLNPNDVIGVIDHNTFLVTPTRIPIYAYNKNWNGQPFSAGSWSDTSHFGTAKFLFIEDNIFTFDVGTAYAVIDCYGGSRWVFRYNTVTRGHLEIHGTDSAGRWRGGRAFEVYNNSFTGPTLADFFINGRSGIFAVHDNTTTGITGPNIHLAVYRMFYPFWQGGADGANVWDVNHPGGPFYIGTAATASSGTTVTVFGNPNWTTNQWAGYSVRRTTNLGGANGVTFGEILSNANNTLTYTNNGSFPLPNLSFAAGDSLEIRKVDQAMDQPGRSGGSLVLNDPPTLPPGWNNQITDPCYEWNNTKTEGGSFHFSSGSAVIRANEHYFNSTVKPGYTPYTYPHPLDK
jgi:hypothetical protein